MSSAILESELADSLALPPGAEHAARHKASTGTINRAAILDSFMVIPPFCQSMFYFLSAVRGSFFCRYIQAVAIADGIDGACPDALSAPDAFGMIGCADHIDVHLTNL